MDLNIVQAIQKMTTMIYRERQLHNTEKFQNSIPLKMIIHPTPITFQSVTLKDMMIGPKESQLVVKH